MSDAENDAVNPGPEAGLGQPAGQPVDQPVDQAVDLSPEQPDAQPPATQRTSRLPLLLSSGLAITVFAAALVAPLVDRALRGEETARRAADLAAVQTWDITDRAHTTDDVAYPQDPPAGGQHAPVWLACGVYDEPVREENAVHDLEHGTVWITHAPDLSEADLEVLADQLPDNGIMSPREDLPSPVVVTVWGAQLQLDGADDPRLPLFLAEYGDGQTAPEFGASCQGGTPDPQGALPGEGADA